MIVFAPLVAEVVPAIAGAVVAALGYAGYRYQSAHRPSKKPQAYSVSESTEELGHRVFRASEESAFAPVVKVEFGRVKVGPTRTVSKETFKA